MKRLRTTVLVGIMLTGLAGHAGLLNRLNPFRHLWSRNRVETLIVTGNYGKSRLLAELAQHRTKQPILLIDPEIGGATQMFFMPSAPEAMALDTAKYVEFVNYLQPERVVFLGDDRYVAPAYIDQVRGQYPTVVLNSRDWVKNARALSHLLEYRTLPKHYKNYLAKLEAASGGQAVGADHYAAPAGPPEPRITPQLIAPVEEPIQ